MRWIDEPVVEDGVCVRRFDLPVASDVVPGMLWTPDSAIGARPLVIRGHGGASNKSQGRDVGVVIALVRNHGFAAVAVDAPGFGDRQPVGDASRADELRQFARLGDDERARLLDGPDGERLIHQAAQVVEEWKATIDAVQGLDEVGTGPVGYWGMSGGAARGIPFVADEPRVCAAVFGLCGVLPGTEVDTPQITRWVMKVSGDRLEPAARALSVPVLFCMQWDDEAISRRAALNLFDAIGSPEKTMHVNPGGHQAMPDKEFDAAVQFLAEQLGSM